MTTYYYRCEGCRLYFSHKTYSRKCVHCNHENSTDALIKVKRDEPVESGWFKGEKYL